MTRPVADVVLQLSRQVREQEDVVGILSVLLSAVHVGVVEYQAPDIHNDVAYGTLMTAVVERMADLGLGLAEEGG